MNAGNVLVIGNSGVGKSTLINAVIGENKAKVGWGTKGTTAELEIYPAEENNTPFSLIDSVGFEPSFLKRHLAIKSIKDWSKDSTKKGGEEQRINVIWFCIDGAARKLFPEAIEALTQATAIWKSVPIITVITKSYFKKERDENIQMVVDAFSEQRHKANLKGIIPIVAEASHVDENTIIAPLGISELIELTNELMPEGIKAAEKDVASFILKRKRALARSVIAASAAAGIAAGAAPAGISTAALGSLEMAEIKALAKIFEVESNNKARALIDDLVEIGTISVAAKAALDVLKMIPGINIAASTANAIVSGSIIVALGSGTCYIFEKIYLGEKTISDIEWAKKIVEENLANGFIDKIFAVFEQIAGISSKKNAPEKISQAIIAAFGDPKAISPEK